MELQPLKIRFYPKMRSKLVTDYALYMRMTLLGKRTEVSLNYFLKREAWDEKEQALKTFHKDRGFVMNMTNKYRQRAQDVYQQMIQHGMETDLNEIRRKLTGDERDDASVEPTLLKLFKRILERKKALSGQHNTERTIQKYNCCRNHLIVFLKKNYDAEDRKFSQINLQFVEDFEVFLKTDGNCCHNTAMKHIQTLKTIYKSAVAYGYTNKDPFQKFKIRLEEVVRDYLSEQEIQKLLNLDLPTTKLSNVRDLFLFSCFTGLAWIDLRNLSSKHIHLENGKYWIRTRRQKTSIRTNVPLLEVPMGLIRKHCPNFENIDPEERLFNVISNQKTNKNLKQLAKLCGITKILTFHISRHTFATTVTLNNGVPIESVSCMLGHKNIKTTQHYAKLLDKKLEVDMHNLSEKLSYRRI